MPDATPTLIATHSGLRGRPGRELSDDVVVATLGRFVTLLRERGVPAHVAVARDARPEGRGLAALAARTIRAAGLDVVDLGVASTPAAKLSAGALGLGGAVIITGSHLDPSWNGVKLAAAPDFWPVDVSRLPAEPARAARAAGTLGRDPHAARRHADAVCAAVDARLVRRAGLRVWWRGGAGGSADALLDRLGCRVAEEGADAGLRLDADGDRLVLVDEQGRDLDPELTLLLVARARRARTIVAGADTSRAIEATVAGPVHRVAPGELHLLEGLAAHGADLAGEGNGGVIVPEAGQARDGLAAAAAILELMAAGDRPLSALASELPRLARRRTTVACDEEEAREQLVSLAERWAVTSDPEMGVTLERGRAWALVRRSATEPVLRVTTESPDDAEADALHAELLAGLKAPVG